MGGGKFANGATSAAYVSLFNDIPISKAEEKMVADGDWEVFYKARIARGDPYAPRALEIAQGGSAATMFANARLRGGLLAFGKDGYSIDSVRVELAKAYANALDADQAGRIGVLHVEEIAQFHYDVFQQAGMPRYVAGTVYGGTLVTGLRAEANLWGGYVCPACDSVSRFDP